MSKPNNNSGPQKNDETLETPVLGDFDPRVVHTRNPKTGRVIRVNPFKLIVERGSRYYEHPVGSGNLYFEDRHVAGRLEKGLVLLGAEHKEWIIPLSDDEQIARKYAQTEQENQRLNRELGELKQEREVAKKNLAAAKVAPKPAETKVVTQPNAGNST